MRTQHGASQTESLQPDARLIGSGCLDYIRLVKEDQMSRPVFGVLPGIPVGSEFQDRAELTRRGVHRHLQAGIAGTATDGADSIVLSGGYEDDEDLGDMIIYTGSGGRDAE